MKKVISTTLVLTHKEFDTLSDAIDILKEMTRTFDLSEEGFGKAVRAVKALEALWYNDFIDRE